MNDIINFGQEIIEKEIEAIKELKKTIGSSFEKAINLLKNTKGRIIVTGMGKSGHIGLKFAATLSSVGSPAFFVHPGEASHGDLGMITDHDIVIAISNSGETKELGDTIEYCKRFDIPLIGITRNENSTLARHSNILLDMPNIPEACTIGKAPTTSTIMTMALTDALTVTLSKEKGLTKDKYKNWHPGGKLGASLIKIKALMHTDSLPLVDESKTISEALEVMSNPERKYRYGCVGIVDNNKSLKGIITEGDIVRKLNYTGDFNNLLKQNVKEIMNSSPKSLSPEALAHDALRLMDEYNIKVMFVLGEQNTPIGIIKLYDLTAVGVM